MHIKSMMILFLGLLLFGALPAYSYSIENADPGYVIGTGDVLIISQWKDDSLTKEVTVLPDGTITFPLVGEIQAAGKKISTLKNDIEVKIKRYISDPVLTVIVKDVKSMSFYVMGRVTRPAQYPLIGPLNVIQGIATAGGPTPFAETGNIKIMRSMGGTTNIIRFNLDDVAKGKHLEQNITLIRGDVIIVP